MAADSVLDGLVEVFPEVNLSTLIEVSIKFKDDIDAAAEYVIQDVLPNIVPYPSGPSTNEDSCAHGHQHASDDISTLFWLDPVENSSNSNCVQFDVANTIVIENDDSIMVNQLKQSQAGLCPEAFDAPSTSGQTCVSEEGCSDSLQSGSQNSLEVDRQLQHSSSESNSEISGPGGDLSLQDDGSPDGAIRSSYLVNLESLDDSISAEHYKKVTLLSNVAAISEMLQEVELNEEKTKRAISEASLAGNDILKKVEELKEMTTLAVEDNNKVAGEVFAEKSILATEAQELQSRLLSISEETKKFVITIDEMQNTLQRRLAAAEEGRAAAEKAKLEREASAQKTLKTQELSLEAAKEESKRLEQQAQENANLRDLLMDRGQVVDALHGEMLGIFDSIAQLKLRVDMQLPVDEQWQQVSSSLSSSVADEPQHIPSILSRSAVDVPMQQVPSILPSLTIEEQTQQVPLILSTSAVDEPVQQVSSILSRSPIDEPESSDVDFFDLLLLKSSQSSAESSGSLMDDEGIADASDANFALDDSWDIVDDEETTGSPTSFLGGTPMLL